MSLCSALNVLFALAPFSRFSALLTPPFSSATWAVTGITIPSAAASVKGPCGSGTGCGTLAYLPDRGLDAAVDVDWNVGDLLLVDNVLVGHGRRPFTGQRRVLVAMSD